MNDVIAVTAFIGSIFGAGGGAEASNAQFLSELQDNLGATEGREAWDDAMLFGDPEAPTTITKRFDYGIYTGGRVTGSVPIDTGSIVSLDPRQSAPVAAPASLPAPKPRARPCARPRHRSRAATNRPTRPPGRCRGRRRRTSSWSRRSRSATRHDLAVMGPQLGYYYPEIVEQVHLSGPGIEAQGVAVPGLAMYMLIGRTRDYAWSLTSADHDVRDVFAEQLCNPDGSAPTRESDHYLFKGSAARSSTFDAGTLNGTPVRYPTSVHGPVIGTAPSNGRPIALTRRRSTFGRDGLNLAALKDMTDGQGDDAASASGRSPTSSGSPSTGRTSPARRPRTSRRGCSHAGRAGLDRRLPTLGTGAYEWRGYLTRDEHPHAVGGPNGLLLNWNNQSAPGFMHGDDDPYGSVHRVELFDQFPKRVTLADDVGVMNRAATEDVRSPVWPVVSEVLHGGAAPNALDAQAVALLDDWVRRDAPRLDGDDDGQYDDAGPTIMDALWPKVADAVMRPVYGALVDDLNRIRNLGGLDGESFVDKDLRTLLGQRVRGRFNLRYCGNGSLDACRASLWAAVDAAASALAAANGADPAGWRSTASRTGFRPDLIPNTMRTTNRPTFQQVLEFDDRRCDVR